MIYFNPVTKRIEETKRNINFVPNRKGTELFTLEDVKKFKRSLKFKSQNHILQRLQEKSYIKVYNPKNYASRRKTKLPCGKWRKCFVCNKQRGDFWHHIVLLKNGGYQHKHNRIPICELCHNKIHPWMN